MRNVEDISSRHDELCELLIGKVFRNRHMIIVGKIIDVMIEHDCHYDKIYYYAILDNGQKINTIKMKGIG